MQGAIMRTIFHLDENPKRQGLNVHRVRGTVDTWEAYVDLANRITFERQGDVLYVLTNCNHDIIKRA
jgi:hypothetical protein